jgi:CrcB protein
VPIVVAVAIGGALGAAARYGVSSFVTHATNLGGSGTFVVNIGGAFLLGLLLGATEERLAWSQTFRSGLAIGVLGGFTTFSTYMWDTVEHAEGGNWFTAIALLIVTVALGITAMVGGLALGRG